MSEAPTSVNNREVTCATTSASARASRPSRASPARRVSRRPATSPRVSIHAGPPRRQSHQEASERAKPQRGRIQTPAGRRRQGCAAASWRSDSRSNARSAIPPTHEQAEQQALRQHSGRIRRALAPRAVRTDSSCNRPAPRACWRLATLDAPEHQDQGRDRRKHPEGAAQVAHRMIAQRLRLIDVRRSPADTLWPAWP